MINAIVFEKTEFLSRDIESTTGDPPVTSVVGSQTVYDGVVDVIGTTPNLGINTYKYDNIKGLSVIGGGTGVELTLSNDTTVAYSLANYKVFVIGG